MKKIIPGILCTAVLAVMLSGCGVSSDGKKYLEMVDSYTFWGNSASTAIPQYQVYNHVNDFMSDGEIKDGNVISPEGKVKKVLFMGFDGMRADAVSNVVFDENSFDTNGYNAKAQYSAFDEVMKTGGAYIGYCGGEKGEDTQQSTSTSASWTSQFTGAWGTKHGVKENEDSKNLEYKTFMLQYAEKGLQTTIAFDWGQYFDVNLKNEIQYVMDNPHLKMTFCDIDRAKADAIPKESQATDLSLYNYAADPTPSENTPYDEGMRDYIMERLEKDDDIVCGIFHNIDSNGHTYEFSNQNGHYVNSVRNCNNYAYQVLQAVKEREALHNEQWLVVMSNDHGGIGQGHGKQSLEERTTWIASNVKFDEKYYSNGYNGFTVEK